MPVFRVFKDGFENYSVGDLPSTFWFTGNSNLGPAQVVSSALDSGLGPLSGSKMIRLNWDASSPTQFGFTRADFVFPADWGGSDRLFVRFRLRCDADMPTNFVGLHFARFRNYVDADSLQTTVGDNTVVHHITIDNAPLWGGAGSAFFSPSEFLDDSGWQKYEFYFKRSATTHATVWFNGVIIDDGSRVTDASGFAWTGAKFEDISIASNWSGNGTPPDSNNHIYIDEFEVFADTAWNLGGFDNATIGSMEDGTIAGVDGGGGSAIAPTVLPRSIYTLP